MNKITTIGLDIAKYVFQVHGVDEFGEPVLRRRLRRHHLVPFFAEHSHQRFRRREGAMARFRDVKTPQKFTSAHASIHNHFNLDRHLNQRAIFKENRSAATAEWRQLAA